MSLVGVNETAKEAAVLQALIKLQAKLPKQLAHFKLDFNCELSLAVALTKLNRLVEAQVFSKRAVLCLERELRINLKIPIEDNAYTGTSKSEKEIHKRRMQSLCIALHNLGSINMRLEQWDVARQKLAASHSLALRYLEDDALLGVIESDLEVAQRNRRRTGHAKRTPMNYSFAIPSKPVSARDLVQMKEHYRESLNLTLSQSSALIQRSLNELSIQQPSEQELVREIFGSNRRFSRKNPGLLTAAVSSQTSRVNSPRAPGLMFDFLSPREPPPNPIKAQPSPSDSLSGISSSVQIAIPQRQATIDTEIPKSRSQIMIEMPVEPERPPVLTLVALREIERKAAITIQRHIRGFLARKPPPPPLAVPTMTKVDSPPISTRSSKRPRLSTTDFLFLKPVELNEIQFAPDKPLVRTRASLKDYLTLEVPEVMLMKMLSQNVYQWTIRVVNVRVEYALCFDLEMHGVLTNWTKALLHVVKLSFDPTNIHDFRVMKPFTFTTLWPIVVTALEELENRNRFNSGRDVGKGLEPDESAIEQVLFLVEQILQRYSVTCGKLGDELVPFTHVSDEESLEEMAMKELGEYRYKKDGVVKNIFIHLQHLGYEAKPDTSTQLKQLQHRLIGTILERGLIKLQGRAFFLTLSVGKEPLGAFVSCALIDLHDRNSNWDDQLQVSWETIQGYLQSFGYFMHIPVLFHLKRMPAEARLVFYEHLQSVLEISGSSLHFNKTPKKATPMLDLSPITEDIYVGSNKPAVRINEVDFATGGQLLTWSNLLPETVYTKELDVEKYLKAVPDNEALLLLPVANLAGEKDQLHLKLGKLDGGIIIIARALTSEKTYALRVRNNNLLSHLIRVCEQGNALSAAVLQSEMQVRHQDNGKVLSFNWAHPSLVHKQLRYRGVRLICNESCLASVYLNEMQSGGTFPTVIHSVPSLDVQLDVKDVQKSSVKFVGKGAPLITEIPQFAINPHAKKGVLDEQRQIGVQKIWEVNLFVMKSGKTFMIQVNDADFKTYFSEFLYFTEKDPTQNSSVYSDMDLETLFYLPFVDKLKLLRTTLGQILVWNLYSEDRVMEKAERLTVNRSRTRVLRQLTAQEAQFDNKLGILSYTEQELQVLLQRGKVVCGQEALITVIRHSYIEEWRLVVYFFASGRQYVVRIYDSDLFNLTETALSKHYDNPRHVVNSAAEAVSAWELILHECHFERSDSDMKFMFDRIEAPMREVLYMQYLTDYAQHTHYAEAFIKETLPEGFTALTSLEEASRINLVLRAYSFEKRVWVKETMSLEQAITTLMYEKALDEQVLENRRVSYSELRRIAGKLLRTVRLSNRVKHINKQKLLPEISRMSESSEIDPFVSGEWQRREPHSLSSIYEHDLILYQEALPPFVAVIFYNTMLDEFIYVIYRPADGTIYRKHLAKKAVRKHVPHCEALLAESLHVLLGRRILYAFFENLREAAKATESSHISTAPVKSQVSKRMRP